MAKKLICGLALFGLLIAWNNLVDAGEFIVKDGKANAEIIIAEKPTRSQKFAAEELKNIIKKISGAELTVTTKETDDFPVKIYIGKSDFTDKLKLSPEGLNYDAYKIVTGNNYIVFFGDDSNNDPNEPYAHSSADRKRAQKEWDKLTGARWKTPGMSTFKSYSKDFDLWMYDGKGSLNAVYDFLRSLGARWYFPGELGECLPELKNIELPKTNKTIHPDFNLRYFGGSGYVYGRGKKDVVLWSIRLGWCLDKCKIGAHGIDWVIHHENVRKNHLDWFKIKNGKRDIITRGGQPCLSSKGLMQSNIEFARTYFNIYPDMEILGVMPTDGYVILCECDLCKNKGTPERGYNGFLSDYVWKYVNDVAKEVYKTHPNKKILCAAYTAYQLPPLNIDKMSPNIMVMLCQSRRNNNNPEIRKKALQLRELWLPKLTGKKAFNTHDNVSSSGSSPFPMYYPRLIAEDLKSLKGICTGDYIEANTLRPGDEYPYKALAITHLNMYVTSRLWWDANQDIDALLEDYYDKFYGPAAKEIKEFIEFSEANWKDMNKNADLVIKNLELLEKAKKAGGEKSVYAQRIALVDQYMDHLKQLKDKIAIGRKNNPKARVYDSRSRNITVDGKLDEEIWQIGPAIHLREIQTGRNPHIRTWFRPAWKNNNLYFAIYCQEPDMQSLDSGTNRNEDTSIWDGGDTVEILLETQNHSYYQIAINPAGSIMDADRKNGFETTWNSDAKVAIHKDKDFWSIEVCIPVADEMQEENLPLQLVSGRRPTLNEPWYFNIGRIRKRESETEISMYSPTGKPAFHVVDKFGILFMEK